MQNSPFRLLDTSLRTKKESWALAKAFADFFGRIPSHFKAMFMSQISFHELASIIDSYNIHFYPTTYFLGQQEVPDKVRLFEDGFC